MELKKFKINLNREGKETFSYESDKEDALVVNEAKKTISLSLKGDKCKKVETSRFDEIVITSGKETNKFSTRSFTKILDNGVTKITFNLK